MAEGAPATAPEPGGLDGLGGLDAAIARWLREESRAAGAAVVALGPAGLRRAVELYYGGARSGVVSAAAARRHGREMVDAWAGLLGMLAAAYPVGYLDEVRAGRVRLGDQPTLELVILGGIDRPEAAELLRGYRHSDDWLVRYHVVRGLSGRTDPASIAAVEEAATDREQIIRDQATKAMRTRRRRQPPAGPAPAPGHHGG
jgi:hypothetical protein